MLDPEQNSTFSDHYLDVDFDLSEVMFITTANVFRDSGALRDRMEVLRLPGYLNHEKMGIARRFLIPKQVAQHGSRGWGSQSVARRPAHTDHSLYARGRRPQSRTRDWYALPEDCALQGQRKAAAGQHGCGGAGKNSWTASVSGRRVPEHDRIGMASGLAWTEFGGDVLPVEVMVLPGAGKLSLTGRLGEVMRESARIALSYARSRASFLGLSPEFADHLDLHLHIPEGAIPKDGPSAGVCIVAAVMSALTRVPVRRDIAMTGEITLLGEVLPIGGLNEKVVAAQLAGFSRLLLPRENEPDWEEIPLEARRGLQVIFVDHVDEVLRAALAPSAAMDRLLAASRASRDLPPEGLPGIAH